MELERIRCAAFRSATGADPVGTAAHHRAFLCATVPLPWGQDISTSPPFDALGAAPVLTGTGGRQWRAQGLVPSDESTAVVLAFVAEADETGAVGPFERREWRPDPARVTALCRAVLDDDADALSGFDHDRREVAADVVDVLVCAHGRRDPCCGSAGAALAGQFRSDEPSGADGRRVRVWRTSHTGGHRFAATALTFPDGYTWAHLGPSDIEGLRTGRSIPSGSCRGWSAAAPGPAQVADREGLVRFGSQWAGTRRRIEVAAHDRRTLTTTMLVTASLSGRFVAYEVDVTIVDHLPQPTCGVIDQPEYTTERVWGATEVRVLDQ